MKQRETIIASGATSEPSEHTQATARPWEEAADHVCRDVGARVGAVAREVAESFYQEVLDATQDYLRENVAYNLSSELSMLRREIASRDSKIEVMTGALENLIGCANAICGADSDDPEAEEAFQMFTQARSRARAALAGAK